MKIDVGVYYFPNYHVDTRNELVHGKAWTEWKLVEAARPRWKGHRQPRLPLHGWEDEADPACMAGKIDLAADNGVDFWIFDWYMYDDGPFLQRALEEGYLKAPNEGKVKFALMWANHDWVDIHPQKLAEKPRLLYPGKVSGESFRRITDYAIQAYFSRPSYYTIDGAPYFSFYELSKLMETFGTVEATRAALDDFRGRVRAAGHPGVHLNAVVWGNPIIPGECTAADPVALVQALGFDSVSSYVWIHHVPLTGTPADPNETPYDEVRDAYFRYWDQAEAQFSLPYYPNLTMGWDSTPRTVQSDIWDPAVGYPFMGTIGGNTPAAFREACAAVKSRLDGKKGGHSIVTVNAWNEWTEGSYLEPDTENGTGYLEALRAVFGK